MTFFKQIIILMKIDKQMLRKAETRNSNGCELMDTEAAFRRCFSK